MRGALSGGVWNQLDWIAGLRDDGPAQRRGAAGPVCGKARRRGGGRVRGAGRALRADGPGRLPPRAGQPARGRGCVPGHIPGPGAEGELDRAAGATGQLALRRRPSHGPRRPRRAVRRKARERRVHAISRSEIKPAGADQPDLDELRAILDEELSRLPERYRGALVLCELDGLTRRAAARRLGIPEGTLSSRLARAKDFLRRRLVRRGLALSALALDQALVRADPGPTLVVPLSLVDSTIRAATRVAAGATLAEAASTSIATLAQGVLKAMLLAKVKEIVSGAGHAGSHHHGRRRRGAGPSQVAAPGTRQGLQISVAVAQPPSMTRQSRWCFPAPRRWILHSLARSAARFAPARVVELARVWDFPQRPARPEHRELKLGDKVKKGDLLAVFHSADVASKMKDLLDALVQLELDQQILDRADRTRPRSRRCLPHASASRAGGSQRGQPGPQQPQVVGHSPGRDRRSPCRGQEDQCRQGRVAQDPRGPLGKPRETSHRRQG